MSGFALDFSVTRRTTDADGFRVEAHVETHAGITVVSGPSGAGKSTLLLAILGALRPDRGRIALADCTLFDSANGVNLRVRDRRLGMVFQEGALFPHMTVLQNVLFAARGADRQALANRLLDQVGAASWRARFPRELSGGQRQRVVFARALAARPRALLLDEPFSALDRVARARLGDLLLELREEAGIPFLHVTHDLAEALRLADRLILLDGGRVVAEGSAGDVLAVTGSGPAHDNLFLADIVRHHADAGYTEIAIGGVSLYCGLIERDCGHRAVFSLGSREPLLAVAPPGPTSARNVVKGTVRSVESHGAGVLVVVETPHPLSVSVTPSAVAELDLTAGRPVYLLIKAAALRCLT
jgi:molybdate transport system ATP-binding protein